MLTNITVASGPVDKDVQQAFVRGLSCVLGTEYAVSPKYFEEMVDSVSREDFVPQEVLLIINTQQADGVLFLRKYWAGLLQTEGQWEVGCVMVVSFDSLQEAIQRNITGFVLCADGIEFFQIPIGLEDLVLKIKNNSKKDISFATIKKYLGKSCELGSGAIVAHARNNVVGPRLLLSGARQVGDISANDFDSALAILKKQGTDVETGIFAALAEALPGIQNEPEDNSKLFRNKYADKKILLIDDESARWMPVLTALFGNNVVTHVDGGGRWKNYDDVFGDEKIRQQLPGIFDDTSKKIVDWDLVLLDLYLTPADEDIRRSGQDGEQNAYTGLRLLEKIRNLDDSLPVILFTASNKAFNLKDAEDIGIDGYFLKESGINSAEDIKEYYERFKELVWRNTNYNVKAARAILKAGHVVFNAPGEESQHAKNALKALLASAKSAGGQEKDSLLIASAVQMGTVLDLKPLNQIRTSYELSRSFSDVNASRYMVMQVRHDAAHAETRKQMEDNLLAACLFVGARGGVAQFAWRDELNYNDPAWEKCLTSLQKNQLLGKEAEGMVDSICKHACPMNTKTCKWPCRVVFGGVTECKGFAGEKRLNRSMYIAMRDNLVDSTVSQDELFYKYLFYIILHAENSAQLPETLLPLIKSRLSFVVKDIMYPPFDIDGKKWNGVMISTDKYHSSLGDFEAENISEAEKLIKFNPKGIRVGPQRPPPKDKA